MTDLQATDRNIRDLTLRQDEDKSPPRNQSDSGGQEITSLALTAALDKKALEPSLLDVRDLCSYTDFVFIVSARSDRQIGAIVDGVRTELKQKGYRPLSVEGETSGQWALLDYGDAVIHVFYHPTREAYDLESLWSDAARVELDVPAEARITADNPIY